MKKRVSVMVLEILGFVIFAILVAIAGVASTLGFLAQTLFNDLDIELDAGRKNERRDDGNDFSNFERSTKGGLNS